MPAIDNNNFDVLMQPLGPFEDKPDLAVAVSGGADSMALVLLAQAWATRRGGGVTALTVDHGLRQGSADETRQVRAWLAVHGIAHQTLRWQGAKPDTGIQAAARQARYELLAQWCRRRGILHLLTAHHSDDQAETVLLRHDKGSGVDGLSGMAAVRALPGVRLLRPLLTRKREDLVATLAALGQPWLEDPSNQEPRFARVRARRQLRGEGGERDRLLDMAENAAVERRKTATALAALAVRAVRLHPAGFCWFDPSLCRGPDKELLAPLLADILRCIGGGIHRPRRERVARLSREIADQQLGGGRTLGGARVLQRAAGLLICREAGRLPRPTNCTGNTTGNTTVNTMGRWDRFDWTLRTHGRREFTVGALGQDGWRQVRNRVQNNLPAPVRVGLPALWRGDRVLAVEHLELTPVSGMPKWWREIRFSAQFSPSRPLQPDGLTLV
ncbi:MAG: tRNA lysidine(34) synthetase TilS [Rhodospirillaceae bacterium]|jgi:tRNA(Ile)-lysidine synthase|nr:tRNA lysidine(34) synthetase TilS [Rhodospirillaceae bacterium]MBT6428015.1 tRNA lysidine(34) synthetase TilS [Rhodospirillaceae bacterium]MBT7759701.1 tRNA lysidine(34) synthetase TilS [Rhodospirillaceae bacterium]